MFGITCGNCGHEGEIDTFTATPSGADLPQNHYQCPACGVAWKRVPVGPWRIVGDMRVPDHIEIQEVPAVL